MMLEWRPTYPGSREQAAPGTNAWTYWVGPTADGAYWECGFSSEVECARYSVFVLSDPLPFADEAAARARCQVREDEVAARMAEHQAREAALDAADRRELEEIAEEAQARDPAAPVDRTQVETTAGNPVTPEALQVRPETGQQREYVVLTEAERARGFVRPVRRTYVHRIPAPRYPVRDLTAYEQERFAGSGYAVFEVYPESEAPKTGRYWTQVELDRAARGCGAATTMGNALAETWARDVKFYGQTFCVGCRNHYPVAEFRWDDGSVLGS